MEGADRGGQSREVHESSSLDKGNLRGSSAKNNASKFQDRNRKKCQISPRRLRQPAGALAWPGVRKLSILFGGGRDIDPAEIPAVPIFNVFVSKGGNFRGVHDSFGGPRWTIGVGDSMGPRLQSLSSTRSDTRCVGGRAVAVPFFGRAVRKIIAQAECPDQDPLRQETQGERRALATHRGCSVASAATSRLRECRRHAL